MEIHRRDSPAADAEPADVRPVMRIDSERDADIRDEGEPAQFPAPTATTPLIPPRLSRPCRD